MCIECDGGTLTRRSFITTVTAAVAGSAVRVRGAGLTTPERALDDPEIIHQAVTFKNGADTIDGYLARPKAGGRRRAVIILHGNAGIPEDIRNAAAQMAQAGFIGLAVSSTSREPDATKISREFVSSHRYLKRYMRDARSGIDFLKAQPFVGGTTVGVVGFCGGGITGLMLSALSEEVAAVVALYAAPFFMPGRNSPTDPRPNLITFVKGFRAPVQCHFGTRDHLIPAEDVGKFEEELRRHEVAAEVYTYEGADHAFYDYTRSNYKPDAAELVRRRMVKFLRRHLTRRDGLPLQKRRSIRVP